MQNSSNISPNAILASVHPFTRSAPPVHFLFRTIPLFFIFLGYFLVFAFPFILFPCSYTMFLSSISHLLCLPFALPCHSLYVPVPCAWHRGILYSYLILLPILLHLRNY